MITPPVKLTMESDASTKGRDAYCQEMRAGIPLAKKALSGYEARGPWQRMEKNQHINLLAAFLALQTFAAAKTNTHVLLWLDNRTAIAYINQKGGTHSKPQSDIACTLWNWCLKKGSAKEILQLSPGSRCNSSGCILTELESPLSVCIPTISASGKNSPEDPTRRSTESSGHSSSMAKTTLVSVVAAWR